MSAIHLPIINLDHDSCRCLLMIDHYFDVMTSGGDLAMYHTDEVTWTMTDTSDEVRGPSSVRDYIVGLHNNMLAHDVVSDGHAYIEGDCQGPAGSASRILLLHHIRHRRWPNHSHALLRSDRGHGSPAHMIADRIAAPGCPRVFLTWSARQNGHARSLASFESTIAHVVRTLGKASIELAAIKGRKKL